jgi:hypothetical protein
MASRRGVFVVMNVVKDVGELAFRPLSRPCVFSPLTLTDALMPANICRAARGFSTNGTVGGRPLCYSDPVKKIVDVRGGSTPFKPSESFWSEVADSKSVADAAKYVNNIENYVGTVKVPVGLIGPLKISMDDEPRAGT